METLNRRMGKLMLVGLAVLAFIGTAMPVLGSEPPPSGGPGGRMPDPDQALKHLASQLNLTAAQQKQIRPLLVDEMGQLKGLTSNPNLNRREQQTKVEAIRNATFERIRALLTPEQQAKHEELRKQDMERARREQGGTGPSRSY